MTVETRDSEFRHPETVAFLRSLTDEEAASQPPSVREHDGVATHYWREGGRVCCHVAADAALPGLQDMRHRRLENMRCPDFLEWRACRGAAASPKT